MRDPKAFYDGIAAVYHLIFEDWDRSIARQREALAPVVERWASRRRLVLDVSSGIGTQTIALGGLGFDVVGSDISTRSLIRARRESQARGVRPEWVAADFRALPFRTACADVVMACDNALPHLLSLADIRTAISELERCVRPGGGVLISLRDYTRMPPGTRERRPYGERDWNGRRVFVEQEWEWQGETYTLTLRVRPLDGSATEVLERSTTYFAVAIENVLEAMQDAGLSDVQRIDGAFYQPLLIGTARERLGA